MLYFIFSLILTAAALRGALAVLSTRFGAKNILRSCLLFKGNFTIKNLYNSTILVIDPYERAVVDMIEFPGILHTPRLFRINLTDTNKGVYNSFVDVELDLTRNVYINRIFLSTIMKLEKCGRGKVPKTLFIYNNTDRQLLKFDMRSLIRKPVAIPITPNIIFLNSDANYLPPKYNNTVWLISGGPRIKFIRTIEKASLGLLLNHLATAVVDGVDAVSGGNRTTFPFIDITDRVEKLLSI
ncbi:hypothetical protein BKA61DRAFT_633559 [Leptodontidium sp. MPI-SDFR-AT-0119]|nr:hypothetical protein BKA61DRAFT_633559 [Leptodontidium sp. MPI-SDFR-AT-0119]